MGNKRNTIIALLTASIFVFTGMAAAHAQEDALEPIATTDASIDYAGFLELAETLEPIRQNRLVDLDTFNKMKADQSTIILDTRSAEAFMMGHIEGQ